MKNCKHLNNQNKGLYERSFKRKLDFLLSLLAIIILSPIMIIIAILVKKNLGGPILFKQRRPGFNENVFEMYKFKSMSSEKDEHGNLLPDAVRLTQFGRNLRSTSLDELPSLFNILKGDMSIIGPRPLLEQYLPYYTKEERVRHTVKPGLSGLAQINGRNTASWEDRFAYDIEYVNKITLLRDVKIIFLSILKALKRTDIGEQGVDSPIDFDKYRSEGHEDYM